MSVAVLRTFFKRQLVYTPTLFKIFPFLAGMLAVRAALCNYDVTGPGDPVRHSYRAEPGFPGPFEVGDLLWQRQSHHVTLIFLPPSFKSGKNKLLFAQATIIGGFICS